VCHRILAHPQGFVGQVAWSVVTVYMLLFFLTYHRSPSGNILLTKLNRKIKVWTEVSLGQQPHTGDVSQYLLCGLITEWGVQENH
jgi:hypothetical protein